jgi:hypothetical protein
MEEKKSLAYYTPECEIESFKCPIGLNVMENPVLFNDGHTYDLNNIKKHLNESCKSPLTNQEFIKPILLNNYNLKSQIEEWNSNNIIKKEIILENDLIKNKDDKENVTCEKIELFHNEFTYIGSVKDGRKDGEGKLILNFNNEYGICNNDKNYIYDGEWLNNKKNGKGELIDNGVRYVSIWIDDKKNGGCLITYHNVYIPEQLYNPIGRVKVKENCIIQCEYQDDEIVTSGIIFYENGTKYIGEINNRHCKDGNGELHFLDGTICKGVWNNDFLCSYDIIFKGCTIKSSEVSEFILNLQEKSNNLINYQIDKVLDQVHPDTLIEVKDKELSVRFLINDEIKDFFKIIFDKLFLEIINKIKIILIKNAMKDFDSYDYISEDSSDDEIERSEELFFKGISNLKLSNDHFYQVIEYLYKDDSCEEEIKNRIFYKSNAKSLFDSKRLGIVIKTKSVFKTLKMYLRNIFNNVKIDYDVIISICTFLEVIMTKILELAGEENIKEFKDDNTKYVKYKDDYVVLKMNLDTVKSMIKDEKDLNDLFINKLGIDL